MNKKYFLSGMTSLFSLGLVSAQETKLGQISSSAFSGASEFLSSIQLTQKNLSVILLGMLLWIILYSIVGKIFGAGRERMGRIFSGVVALIITILAFLYLPADFVEAITLQYSAMGAAILTAIPFIILLYFSIWVSSSLIVSRVTWIFYIVYYLALFIYKLASMPASESLWSPSTIPYWAAIIAGILIFIFIPALRKFVFKGELEAIKEKGLSAADRRKALLRLERENLDAFGG